MAQKPLTSNPFVVFIFIYAFPFIAGIIYAEWTDREFHIHLGWAAISIAYCYVFKFKPFIVIISLLFIITSCIDIQYAITFGGVFTSSSVEALAQTNSREAIEFIFSYFDWWSIIITIIYCLTSLYCLYRLKCNGLHNKKRYQILALFFLLVLCIFIIQGLIIKQRYTKLLPGIVGAFPAYLKSSQSLADETQQRAALSQSHTGTISSYIDANTEQTYIVIIGEAMARKHMNLYGYKRDTTPQLSSRDDLILFNNVISNFLQTLPSLRFSLTEATDEKPDFRRSLSILDAANIAGFKTYWISNQQPLRGTYSAIGAQADKTVFISNNYHGREVERFDGLLLPEFEKALTDPDKRKVIFLHLMGSHLNYVKRYPKAFDYFSSPPYFAYRENITDKEAFYINSYDNSIRYTDWVIDQTINTVQLYAKNKLAALVFFSDHGEEVFDQIAFKGHGPDTLTKSSFDIPFIVWLSDSYKSMFSSKVDILKNHQHSPYMLNHFFHFCLDMMNLTADRFSSDIKSKSLFSNELNTGSRIVYDIDYDSEFMPTLSSENQDQEIGRGTPLTTNHSAKIQI